MPDTCNYSYETFQFRHSLDQHPRDSDFKMHVHEQYEIFYYISGEAHYLVEGTEYPLEPGYLLLMRPTESHRIKILADKPYERFTLHFLPSLFDTLDPSHRLLACFENRPLGKQNLYLPTEFHSGYPIDLFTAMSKSIVDPEAKRLDVLIHSLSLLSLIGRAFEKKQLKEKDCAPEDVSEEIVGYINRHLFEELSLEFLGKHFFMSSSQLGRLFKKTTGSSVWEYILIKRLMAVRSLIRSGIPICKAAFDCGFHDYSAFYRAYTKKFGVSPKKDASVWSEK